MNDISNFQANVSKSLGNSFNFSIDRAHANKPVHADFTYKIPGFGADKTEVDFNGNIIGGSTHIGHQQLKWYQK